MSEYRKPDIKYGLLYVRLLLWGKEIGGLGIPVISLDNIGKRQINIMFNNIWEAIMRYGN